MPCHAMPMSRCAVALRSRFQNGIVVAWHWRGMAIRWHCVNEMGKTQYKPLAERHGIVNWPLKIRSIIVLLFAPRSFQYHQAIRPKCMHSFVSFMLHFWPIISHHRNDVSSLSPAALNNLPSLQHRRGGHFDLAVMFFVHRCIVGACRR
jgi:hypothetical protein